MVWIALVGCTGSATAKSGSAATTSASGGGGAAGSSTTSLGGSGGVGGAGGSECLVAADCPGEVTECAWPDCAGGQCTTAFAAQGTLVAEQVYFDCRRNVCDGAGAVELADDANDPPNDQNGCTQDLCVEAFGHLEPSLPPEPAGTPCTDGGGLKCDGAGVCYQCDVDADCSGVPHDGMCVAGWCECVPDPQIQACTSGFPPVAWFCDALAKPSDAACVQATPAVWCCP